MTLDPAVQSIAFSDMISTDRLLERDTFIETVNRPHSVEQWFTISDGLHTAVRIIRIRKWSQLVTQLFDTKRVRQNACFLICQLQVYYKSLPYHQSLCQLINKDFGNAISISHPYKIPLENFEMCVGEEFRTQVELSCKRWSITYS